VHIVLQLDGLAAAYPELVDERRVERLDRRRAAVAIERGPRRCWWRREEAQHIVPARELLRARP
jgi:hypothetical protein